MANHALEIQIVRATIVFMVYAELLAHTVVTITVIREKPAHRVQAIANAPGFAVQEPAIQIQENVVTIHGIRGQRNAATTMIVQVVSIVLQPITVVQLLMIWKVRLVG